MVLGINLQPTEGRWERHHDLGLEYALGTPAGGWYFNDIVNGGTLYDFHCLTQEDRYRIHDHVDRHVLEVDRGEVVDYFQARDVPLPPEFEK